MVSRLKNKKGFEVFLKACDIFKSKVVILKIIDSFFVTGYKSNFQKVKVLKKSILQLNLTITFTLMKS